MRQPAADEARAFLAGAQFVWHRQFELAPGLPTPGVSPADWLLAAFDVPRDLHGKTVLDIGTTNGAVAFEAERRGADRVVAVDILDIDWFGFRALAELFDSKAEFLQCSLYELPDVLQETFDVVVFWGVLYHLRHPLLGLDAVRRVRARRRLPRDRGCRLPRRIDRDRRSVPPARRSRRRRVELVEPHLRGVGGVVPVRGLRRRAHPHVARR